MIRRAFLKAFALPAMIPGRGKRMPFGNAVGEGFVNPGVVVAKKVIVEGANGGVFIYSSAPPAAGNLIASVGPGGLDGVGNLTIAGSTTYRFAGGFYFANASNGGNEVWYSATSPAGPWTVNAQISVGTSGGLGLVLNNGAVNGSWPVAGGSSITTVAQLVTVLETLGLLTP